MHYKQSHYHWFTLVLDMAFLAVFAFGLDGFQQFRMFYHRNMFLLTNKIKTLETGRITSKFFKAEQSLAHRAH